MLSLYRAFPDRAAPPYSASRPMYARNRICFSAGKSLSHGMNGLLRIVSWKTAFCFAIFVCNLLSHLSLGGEVELLGMLLDFVEEITWRPRLNSRRRCGWLAWLGRTGDANAHGKGRCHRMRWRGVESVDLGRRIEHLQGQFEVARFDGQLVKEPSLLQFHGDQTSPFAVQNLRQSLPGPGHVLIRCGSTNSPLLSSDFRDLGRTFPFG